MIDWGMNATSQLNHQGRLRVRYAEGPVDNAASSPDDAAQLRSMLSDPSALWVDHVADREIYRGVGANLERFASAAGYRRELLRTVSDSNGRPVFQIFRFSPG